MQALSSFKSLLFKRDFGQIKGVSFELLLASLDNNKEVAIVLPSELIEDVATIYNNNIGKKVLCFFSTSRGEGVEKEFVNFFDNIHLASKQSLERDGLKNKVLFIEDGFLNLKTFKPSTFSQKIKVDGSCSFNFLLEKLGAFSFVQEGVHRPGTFIIKGGVVDVCLFGSLDMFRISFLDENTKIYKVDKRFGTIVSRVDFFYLSSCLRTSQTLSINDILSKKGIPCFLFNNNSLFYKKGGNKIIKLETQVVDFQTFVENYRDNKFLKLKGSFERGFIYQKKLCVPEWFLNPSYKKTDAGELKTKEGLVPFVVGGMYVHEDFGYCQFIGIETRDQQDYLCLKFLDGVVKLDVVYISKLFFFSNECSRKLSSLSKQGVWKKTIRAGEKKALVFVEGLLSAYKQRESVINKRRIVIDSLVEDFVGAFKHKDTQDQNRCWRDIVEDFKSNKPINRLICGDVGFGKTELAIRASFVAAINSLPVVVLAPTTILSDQLFGCFSSRLGPFGVNTGVVSSISQNNKKTILSFLNKKIDVLIGTSAVLFQDEVLNFCSLFVVDEEHRFGVKDKEKIFKINPRVNFLSMSATPIPRSLQLSLSKIRNLSLLTSPPKNRKPIICAVSVFNLKIIKTSILREISRGGQVYIVDNSVNSLKDLKKKIAFLFPLLSINVVFGTMSGRTLSKVMSDFSAGKIQVLLSTTIIESGIDVGSSNTIIINNAHCFGLSQLYQLRGRVGRSSNQAFAWFLIPEKGSLSSNAKKRLLAILEHTSLGVGYKISQEDLEIRGAGSLFGYSQSGQNGVGFELYSHLISKAAINYQQQQQTLPCFVNVFSNSIPDKAVDCPGLKASFYQSIYCSSDVLELNKIKKLIIDRFGFFLQEFQLLFKNKEVEFIAKKRGIKKIFLKKGFVVIVFYLSVIEKHLVYLLSYIEDFFKKKGVSFNFIQSHEYLIFQYKKTSKDDYILLCSFLKNITFV